jgi:cytochrome c biogenesis protein CcmG, thiol:disulfide interchange protein DsbE
VQDQSRAWVFFVIVAVLLGVYLTRDASLGQPAPEFSLLESYGGRVDLASLRGRPVLLVFWMTSCSICQHELPMLNQLLPEFESKGITVVAIHLGGSDAARDYMSANRIDLTSVADPDGEVARAYHVGGVPKLVLIGSDGKVKRISSGWTNKSVLRKWIDGAGGS